MAKQFSHVDGKYGAPMGRQRYCNKSNAKVSLFKVRLVDGAYDDGGAYWGMPSNLYCARDVENCEVQLFVRASNRDEAKKEILKSHAGLRFYR